MQRSIFSSLKIIHYKSKEPVTCNIRLFFNPSVALSAEINYINVCQLAALQTNELQSITSKPSWGGSVIMMRT